jgi:hypothetical protein
MSRVAMGPIQPLFIGYQGSFLGVKRWWGLEDNHSLKVVVCVGPKACFLKHFVVASIKFQRSSHPDGCSYAAQRYRDACALLMIYDVK